MKPHPSIRPHCHGGVLVLALVITAGATAGFAAWTMLLSQRTQLVEQAVAGTQRRLAVESGRQIARQYGYTGVLPNSAGSAVNAKNQAPDGGAIYGGITAAAWTGYAMESTVFPTGHNPISPASTGLAYGKNLAVSLPFSIADAYPATAITGAGSASFLVEVKSRSPLVSGDLLVIHRPTTVNSNPLPRITVSGNLDVIGGRALYLTALSDSLTSSARASQIAVPQLQAGANATYPTARDPQTNAVNLPSNLPVPPMSTGAIGGAVDTTGRLSVVDDASNAGNSFKSKLQTGSYILLNTTVSSNERGVTFDHNTGILTLNLAEPLLPNVVATNHIAKIVLTGQSSGAAATIADPLGAVGLCYVESADTTTRSLTEVTCQETYNKRRFILGFKKVPPAAQSPKAYGSQVAFRFSNSNQAPLWRLMVVAENTPLSFVAAGGPGIITLTGGIESDGSIAAPSETGSSLRLNTEPDPRRLNRLAPRLAWVETHLNLDNGSL